MSSISERLLEGRIKKFLMNAFESMGSYLKDADPMWEVRMEHVAMKAMITALEGLTTDNPVKEAKLLLQGLGFTPVEIQWHSDQGRGEIYLSISRIWKKPIESDQMLQAFVKGVCRGIGSLFFGPKTPVMARLVDDRDIPPRYRALLEFRPATKDEIEKEEKMLAETVLLEMRPDTQKAVDVGPTTREEILSEITAAVFSEVIPKNTGGQLFIEVLEWFAREQLPHELSTLEPLFKRHPERAFLKIYKEAQIRQSIQDWGIMIGEELARRVQQAHSDTPPMQLIQGISFLPLEKVSSLLIYEPTEHTHALVIDKHLPACNFLIYVWEGFLSKLLGASFHLKEFACGVNPTDACIYVYLRKK